MRILGSSILFLALGLAACGGDSTGPSGGTRAPGSGTPPAPRPLSTAELNAIGRAVIAPGATAAQRGVNNASATPRADGVAADAGELPFGFTAPCQPSGSVAVDGTLGAAWDWVQQLIVVHARLTLRHTACTVQTDNGLLTVSGDPTVTLTLTAGGNNTGLKFVVITQEGAVTWLRPSDGASGRCEARVVGAAIAGTPNYRITGTVCGQNVDITGPL